MPESDSGSISADNLRKRAEERAQEKAAQMTEDLETLSPEQTKRIVHELRVHQIELEMQNEELLRVQVELEASMARYFDLYDLAPVGYLTISENGLILEANLSAATLLGVTRSALVMQPFSAFVFREDQDTYYLHRKKLLEASEPQTYELRMLRENGAQFWAQVETAMAQAVDGTPTCRMVMSDVTERKNVENARRKYIEQDKMAAIGKVAGKIAHDFNNVIGIIMGTSELLLAGALSPEVREDIDLILESAFKGRDLTKNLLLFARDQEPKLSRFDLNDRITMVLRSLKSDLTGIKIVSSYGPNLNNVIADAGLLENALINIIQNSIHAMSKTENPEISIKTHTKNREIHIEITDNGCGVPAEHLNKLFNPTFSLKGSSDKTSAYRRDIKGSGYGMANVKRCADKHRGSIAFDSEVGTGTKLTLTLPVIDGHFNAQDMEIIGQQDVVEGKRILIVEDESHYGRILYSLLGKFNHHVALATDGEMALNYFVDNEYDAISLDFMLPDMTGMDVYKKVRDTNKGIPIIFVSGNFEFLQSMMDLKREDPNVDHLAKPFSNVEYVNMIHKWLNKTKASCVRKCLENAYE